ncbi:MULTISPECIES: prenyltransferase/squalene oxidase repeat-containing protein [unclassified Methanoculleus]|uniref:prenyltransferase/squalene oxidase repeat-containing protein n=1 Tax=unclassified Methanoculleus TaxID=2619537 RepID=UPI0025EC611D|nr:MULTISPECIES: prenyltransferase/squalene oxidase repeat-containing protein [unclassified Methanoculleus]MCK9316767.1 terpene cyclase/mutase family protein [Methanoculleus sp.]MDD2252772.1 terpene cyclase/mutase family protein [Methanoculleus sp.]MDD2786495.1 terpene cyclase/mutase family protein [Methanoculleus sp.]MDD3215245.1 terpene cyclase/mutase family protein [Methanoculleus sp.]MDD4313015.1 terpene cyclase/mutase family protein [Methanoculleus sp.]
MDGHLTSFLTRVTEEVRELAVVEGETAYLRDPVFPVVRNRVHAEVVKAMLRQGGDPLVGPILNYVAACQNPDGSYNEIHVNYNEPSALVAAFVGDALLEAADRYPHEGVLRKARDFVVAAEKRPGYFLKSSGYTADHLNVDASCGAFLARYADRYDDEEARAAALRAAENVVRHQREGVYPYAADKGTYPYVFDLPCAHYQGVTIYYLAKINEVLCDEKIERSIAEGVRWLAAAQRPDGRFDWSGSGLSFAYYLSGAYAFAHASFVYASRTDDRYREHAERSLDRLDEIVRGLAPRWEPGPWIGLIPAVATTAKTAALGGYPLKHRAFRFGYGMYRQIARRRYAETAETGSFEVFCRLLGIRPSTVEPSKNFPDLFMTSEMLDCLTQSGIWGNHRSTTPLTEGACTGNHGDCNDAI